MYRIWIKVIVFGGGQGGGRGSTKRKDFILRTRNVQNLNKIGVDDGRFFLICVDLAWNDPIRGRRKTF